LRIQFFNYVSVLLIAAGQWVSHPAQAVLDADPNYLVFQIFTAGPGFRTAGDRHAITSIPDKYFLESAVSNIVSRIGERGDKNHRLGFALGPLALDHTDEQLRTLIRQSFEIARSQRVAVVFHIDDSKFWMNREDLWKNSANVEWLDWNGTPNTGQYLHWGEKWKLAPVICVNSREITEEAYRIANKVIGAAVAEELSGLNAEEINEVFGGVIVGWETNIGEDYKTRSRLGSCALTNRGFSKSNPPENSDEELEAALNEWIGIWAGGIADAGIPENRVYSHTAFKSQKQYEEEHPRESDKATLSYRKYVGYATPSASFGYQWRAGFSVYPEREVIESIYQELERRNNPRWALAEGANVVMHDGRPRVADESMESYLARMFNHGAALVNLFGWGIPGPNPFRISTESDDSIKAYRKFLRGGSLTEIALEDSYAPAVDSLKSRVQGIHAKVREYASRGGNMNILKPKMMRLSKAVPSGDLDEIEAALAAVMKVME
jgi:hypothetical protein